MSERAQRASHAQGAGPRAPASERAGGSGGAEPPGAVLELAKKVGAKIVGVVGRDGGYTATVADACVVVPVVNAATITPHTEAFHAVVWHLIVTHPYLKANEMKWESTR